jgi:hypothetical protein
VKKPPSRSRFKVTPNLLEHSPRCRALMPKGDGHRCFVVEQRDLNPVSFFGWTIPRCFGNCGPPRAAEFIKAIVGPGQYHPLPQVALTRSNYWNVRLSITAIRSAGSTGFAKCV